MKRNFCKVISVLMLLVMLIPTGIAAISSSAASESDYIATFSIKTDKASVKKGETVKVSVNLKTNYYIFSMQVPVIYDSTAFELQNTNSSKPSSFLTFEGRLASAYRTNGNFNSPNEYYEKRNSNPSYWTKSDIKSKYKFVFTSWAADSTLNGGKLIKLANEETIVSFTLKAKKDVSNIDGLVFLHKDFMKTATFAGGLWFCGRSKTEKVDTTNFVPAGQTLKFTGTAPSTPATPDTPAEDKTNAVVMNFRGNVSLKENVASSAQNKTLEWTSADETIVTVDKNGNVYGVNIGETTVTVKSTDGKYSETFTIQVSYAWWQWVVIIVLFGWIWYL